MAYQGVRFKLVVWLALVAMLALVLTPARANALSRAIGRAATSVEAFTHPGERRLEVLPGGAAKVSPPAITARMQAVSHLGNCPVCSLASQVLALPPGHVPFVPMRGADYLAPLFLHAPHTLFAWRGPQSRAPPLTA